MARFRTRWVELGVVVGLTLAGAYSSWGRSPAASRGAQTSGPSQQHHAYTLVFVASEEPVDRGAHTMYAVHVGGDKLVAKPVLQRPNLTLASAASDRRVIVSAAAEAFVYDAKEGLRGPVQISSSMPWLPGPRPDTALLFAPTSKTLRIGLLDVATLRLQMLDFGVWPSASPFDLHTFSLRMSPNRQRIAAFVKRADPSSKGWSLAVLDHAGGKPKLFDRGLSPEWDPYVSWGRGPSLEWLDNDRILYFDSPRGSWTAAQQTVVKMVDLADDRVITLRLEGKAAGRRGAWGDPRIGKLVIGEGGGLRNSVIIDRAARTVRLKPERITQRFTLTRPTKGVEALMDSVRRFVIWRGLPGSCSIAFAPAHSPVVAYSVRPDIRKDEHDIYIYDGRIGRSVRVFQGYPTGLMHWVAD